MPLWQACGATEIEGAAVVVGDRVLLPGRDGAL